MSLSDDWRVCCFGGQERWPWNRSLCRNRWCHFHRHWLARLEQVPENVARLGLGLHPAPLTRACPRLPQQGHQTLTSPGGCHENDVKDSRHWRHQEANDVVMETTSSVTQTVALSKAMMSSRTKHWHHQGPRPNEVIKCFNYGPRSLKCFLFLLLNNMFHWWKRKMC